MEINQTISKDSKWLNSDLAGVVTADTSVSEKDYFSAAANKDWILSVADLVLIAAGFLGSQKYVTDAFKVEVNQRTNVKTDDGKYQTTKENVFTAGDMHRGQSLVVWAIREGREAAKAVDESLMGYTNL